MVGFHCFKRVTDAQAGTPASPIDYNKKKNGERMTEFGVNFFESTGVGANASQMVFLANSPLSELVWSHEGLGVKYTTSSGLGDKKTPLFWNTDTFNIIVNNNNSFSKEDKLMENNHRSISDFGPLNFVMRHDRDSKSCGDIKFMSASNRGFDQKIILNSQYENEEEIAEITKKSHSKRGPNNDKGKSTKIAKCSTSSSKKEKMMQNTRKNLNKGKEKVIYERENNAKESDNESVESTGSIMSKRKRPFKYCNPNNSNLENKRFKKEINSNKSSFMNWISSISNGFKPDNETKTAMIKPLSVARDPFNIEKWPSSSSQKSHESNVKTIMPFVPNGFGSLFHTLYRQNITLSSCSNKKESFSLEKSSPNEGFNYIDEIIPESNEIKPDNINIESGINIEKMEENRGLACVISKFDSPNCSNNDNKSRSNEEKGNVNINENEGYLGNLWITRLLPKEASSTKPQIENNESNEGQSERKRKLKSKLNPIIPSNKHKESDFLASLFAKRLGAIKHAEPSNLKNLEKIEEMERSRSRSKSKSSNNDKKMVLWSENKGKTVINDKSRENKGKTLINETSGERNSGFEEVGSSYKKNIHVKGKGIVRSIDNNNNDDNLLNYNNLIHETSVIFESIRRLRFSRMDIIRWMKSSIKGATLDGFYLRLRLSKLKQAIGRTGYHVGRINGTSGDKFLSVRVGNLTCLVEPHCVSNQDFLEEELSAWCSCAEIGEFNLPSREELEGKLKERHLLGF